MLLAGTSSSRGRFIASLVQSGHWFMRRWCRPNHRYIIIVTKALTFSKTISVAFQYSSSAGFIVMWLSLLFLFLFPDSKNKCQLAYGLRFVLCQYSNMGAQIKYIHYVPTMTNDFLDCSDQGWENISVPHSDGQGRYIILHSAQINITIFNKHSKFLKVHRDSTRSISICTMTYLEKLRDVSLASKLGKNNFGS